MATTLEVSYFNTFWMKRLKNFTKYQEREPDGTLLAAFDSKEAAIAAIMQSGLRYISLH